MVRRFNRHRNCLKMPTKNPSLKDKIIRRAIKTALWGSISVIIIANFLYMSIIPEKNIDNSVFLK